MTQRAPLVRYSGHRLERYWRFLGCPALAARPDFGDRRAGMVRLAPFAHLGAALELHRLDVGAGDDEVVLDAAEGEVVIGGPKVAQTFLRKRPCNATAQQF